MMLILAQLALLFLTAWGWGFWLWRISYAEPAIGWRRHGWFFFGLGGFMACVLFLHGLIYLNLPLKFTAWVGLLVAAGGVAACVHGHWRHGWATGRRERRREALAAGLLFAVVFGFQGAPLFEAGPDRYYGSAHTDQVNYVLLSEFLIEEPLSTNVQDIGLRPWLTKAIALKDVRKGQSVAEGYLAVVSLVDAKRSYGVLSIFMIGVGALGVFVLARVLSMPRTFAWLVAAWWGLLPAITKLHLDGFFSQACVLVVFPAMAAVFRVRRGRLERAPLVLLTIYLAYLLCTYTEVYVIGVCLLFCLALFGVPTGTPWRRRAAMVAAVTIGSLLLTGLFLRDFVHYIINQYGVAADPASLALLAALTPLGGTWLGWKQVFVGYLPLADARLERLSILLGFALLFLIVCAFQSGGLSRRRFLLALVAPPLGVLAVLLSAPEFSKYPFAKLVDTFTPFWLVLAALGVLSLRGVLWHRRVFDRWLARPAIGGLLLVGLVGSWPQWRDTWQDRGHLADVDSLGARRCYAQAQRDPNATYLIDESHRLLCAWLAYAARRSQVYVAANYIADHPIPASIYAFRKQPPLSPGLVILDEKGPTTVQDRGGLPTFIVDNPQGIEGGPDHPFYWVGPDMTLTFSDFTTPGGQTHSFALEFEALAGPANPSPERSIALIGPDEMEQRVDFTNRTTGHFQVKLHAGNNVYRLKVLRPTEQTFRVPGDPRNHMVRIQGLAIRPWNDSDGGTP